MSEVGRVDPPAPGPNAVQQMIDAFRIQCGGASLLLAAHAAVLETMRTETVALLRRNFLSGPLKARADLDADVLYGSMAVDLGGGYVSIDTQIRHHLVIALDAYGGRIGLGEYLSARVARFVRVYAREARDSHPLADDPRFLTYLAEIEWVALGFDEPDKAAQALSDLREEAVTAGHRRVNLGHPAALLSLPLSAFPTAIRGTQALDRALWLKSAGRDADAERIMAPYHSLSSGLVSDDERSFSGLIDTLFHTARGAGGASSRRSTTAHEDQTVEQPQSGAMDEHAGTTMPTFEDTAAHRAIRSGDLSLLSAALSTDIGVLEAFGLKGRTPLTLAAELKDIGAVRTLIDAGANVNTHEAAGGFPLFFAVENDDREMFDLLVDNGADPRDVSKLKKNTALIAAIFYGRIGMFHRLIELGADVNHVNLEGYLPTDFAAQRGNQEMWDTLLSRGGRLCVDSREVVPLIRNAVLGGNPDILRDAIKAGAAIDAKDVSGWRGVLSAAFEGHLRVLELLLELGANPNAADDLGWTPLMIAAWKNNAEAVCLLQSYGANPNIVKTDGYSALLIACYHGNARVVAELLRSPTIDLRHVSLDRKSPLHLAVEGGSMETVRVLLDDPRTERNHRPGGEGAPPIWAAYSKTDKPEIFTALLSDRWVNATIQVQGNSLLHRAIIEQRRDRIQDLIRAGFDLATLNRKGESPVMTAVVQGQPEILRELLANGAPPNAPPGTPLLSPIRTAVEADDAALVSLLLAHGADLSARDGAGRTLLHLAGPETAESLIQAALDPNARDNHGMTPLMHAARLGRSAVVSRLASVGDLAAATRAGWTALHFAVQSGSMETVEQLLATGANPEPVATDPPFTPLQTAAEMGASAICQRLCRGGARVNFHTVGSPPALILALQNGQPWTALDLLRLGADRYLRDPKDGRLPLHALQARRVRERIARSEPEVLFDFIVDILLGRKKPTDPLPDGLRPPSAVEDGPAASEQPPGPAIPDTTPGTAGRRGRQTDLAASAGPLAPGRWGTGQRGRSARPDAAIGPLRERPEETGQLIGGVFLAHLGPEHPEDAVSLPWRSLPAIERQAVLDRIRPAQGSYNSTASRTQVLSMALPFYDPASQLLRVQNLDGTIGRQARFCLLNEREINLLVGTAKPIHDFNKMVPVKIDERNVIDYCRFFGFFVRGGEGPFHLLERANDLALSPTLGQASRDAIAGSIRPATLVGYNSRGHFMIDAVVAYSNTIFAVKFAIHSTGVIEMLEDEPLAANLDKLIDAPLEHE